MRLVLELRTNAVILSVAKNPEDPAGGFAALSFFQKKPAGVVASVSYLWILRCVQSDVITKRDLFLWRPRLLSSTI